MGYKTEFNEVQDHVAHLRELCSNQQSFYHSCGNKILVEPLVYGILDDLLEFIDELKSGYEKIKKTLS